MITVTTPRTGGAEFGTAEHHPTAELLRIHARAAAAVAELSESPIWIEAELLVTRLIAEADHLSDTPQTLAAGAPAVVRCRELAVAQRRMTRALEGAGGTPVGQGAVVRARALLAELTDLLTAARGGPRP